MLFLSPPNLRHRSVTESSVTLPPCEDATMSAKADQPKATLQTRLTREAARLKEAAAALPAGAERNALINRARQFDNALHFNDWLAAPGLQPPR